LVFPGFGGVTGCHDDTHSGLAFLYFGQNLDAAARVHFYIENGCAELSGIHFD